MLHHILLPQIYIYTYIYIYIYILDLPATYYEFDKPAKYRRLMVQNNTKFGPSYPKA